jgi:uncharacterized membrane protein
MSAGAPTPRPPGSPPKERSSSDLGAALGGAALGFVAAALFSAGIWAALSGAGIGAALMLWRAAHRRASELRGAHLALERRVRALEAEAPIHGPPLHEAPGGETPTERTPSAPAAAPDAPPGVPAPPAADPVFIAPSAHHVSRPVPPTPLARALVALRGLLFRGNTVVRVGIHVLLFGVTLLA